MSNIVMIFKQVDYVKLLEKYPKKWTCSSDLKEFDAYLDSVVLMETSYSSPYERLYDILDLLPKVPSDSYTKDSLFTKYECSKKLLREYLSSVDSENTKQTWERILEWLDKQDGVTEEDLLYILVEY
jgi:hypothetical protein